MKGMEKTEVESIWCGSCETWVTQAEYTWLPHIKGRWDGGPSFIHCPKGHTIAVGKPIQNQSK